MRQVHGQRCRWGWHKKWTSAEVCRTNQNVSHQQNTGWIHTTSLKPEKATGGKNINDVTAIVSSGPRDDKLASASEKAMYLDFLEAHRPSPRTRTDQDRGHTRSAPRCRHGKIDKTPLPTPKSLLFERASRKQCKPIREEYNMLPNFLLQNLVFAHLCSTIEMDSLLN